MAEIGLKTLEEKWLWLLKCEMQMRNAKCEMGNGNEELKLKLT